MFKYPENIIVNWLRSKMQGKIDSLQSQVDELEKNYVNITESELIVPSEITYEIINKNSITLSTNTVGMLFYVRLGKLENFVNKNIMFYCDYETQESVALNNTQFISADYDSSNRVALQHYFLRYDNTSYNNKNNLIGTGIIQDDNIENRYLFLRLGVTSSNTPLPNTVSFRNCIVKIID